MQNKNKNQLLTFKVSSYCLLASHYVIVEMFFFSVTDGHDISVCYSTQVTVKPVTRVSLKNDHIPSLTNVVSKKSANVIPLVLEDDDKVSSASLHGMYCQPLSYIFMYLNLYTPSYLIYIFTHLGVVSHYCDPQPPSG